MVKASRPSIADQLAGIASTRPRDDVTTSQRYPFVEKAPLVRREVEVDNVITSSRENVSTRKRGNETPDGMKVRQRIERPHASLYAHPRVFKKLREIAAAEDCKPHDLYVEGLRMILARYGYDLDKLERSEA